MNKSTDGILKRLKSTPIEPSASERFVNQLEMALDQRYHLLCDVYLDDQSEPIPLLLIGPTGLWLIHIYKGKGIFRISKEDWQQLDEKRGLYRSIKPNPMDNLVRQVKNLAQFLADEGISAGLIEPLVYFVHPGAHVDSDHPAVKIVMMDATNRFISRVITSPPVLDRKIIQAVIDHLVREGAQESEEVEIQDAYSLRELSLPKKPRNPSRLETLSRKEPSVIARLSSHLPFSRQQWMLLGALIVINFLILLILVLVVVGSSAG